MKEKMKAAVCKDRETIAIEEVPVPEPGPGEVLVEVKAVGLCGSDVDGYTGHHPMIRWPIVLGHECAGVIAAVGPGRGLPSDGRWKEGDAVVVEPFFTCKKCPACLRSEYNLCVDLKLIGHQLPGCLAEYVLAEDCFLHPKPENMPFAEAALAEPVAAALHAVERCNLRLGDFVVILGCGTIGVLAMQHALNKGAEVLVADLAEFKLAAARELGAQHTLNPGKEDLRGRVKDLTSGLGADCVIEAIGLPETLAETVKLARRGGKVCLIGWSGNETDPFDLTTVTIYELTVLGTVCYCWDHPTALKLMSSGKVKVGPLITHRLPLARTGEGLRMLHNHEDDCWKIVIADEKE